MGDLVPSGSADVRASPAALHPPTTACAALTVDDPLDPPDAQGDDEADGVPGAAGPVGHRGGHHGGQGQHDDGAVKYLIWRGRNMLTGGRD